MMDGIDKTAGTPNTQCDYEPQTRNWQLTRWPYGMQQPPFTISEESEDPCYGSEKSKPSN